MMKRKKNMYQTVMVIRDALRLLETPGMTLEYLRELDHRMLNTGGPHWTVVDRMEHEAILAAIEMLTNPVFVS